MSGFLKTFGWGVLYVVLLPFLLIFVAIFMLYLFISFVIFGFKSLIVFFMGRSPLGDLPEDIEAKRILEERELAKSVPSQTTTNVDNSNTTTNSNNVTYNQTLVINPNDLVNFLNSQNQKNNVTNEIENNGIQEIEDIEPLFLETSEEGEEKDEFIDSINR